MAEGTTLGGSVAAVGASVGLIEGDAVGMLDGIDDGLAEGESLGITLGTDVGLSVGTCQNGSHVETRKVSSV